MTILLIALLLLHNNGLLTSAAPTETENSGDQMACYPASAEEQLDPFPTDGMLGSGAIAPHVDLYDEKTYKNGDYILIRRSLKTLAGKPSYHEGDLTLAEDSDDSSRIVSIFLLSRLPMLLSLLDLSSYSQDYPCNRTNYL